MSQPAHSVTWQTWRDALPKHWASCFDESLPLTHQQPLAVEEAVFSDKVVSSQQFAHTTTDVSQNSQEQLYKRLHMAPSQQPPILRSHLPPMYSQLCCPPLASPADCVAVLGIMVSLLDGIAGDHVFGKIGSPGRPRGCMTLDKICSMKGDNFLSKQQQHRWSQFLQIWKAAGWECHELVLLAGQLRPLQYGHPQDQAHIAKFGAEQMLVCINMYGDSQGHRRFKLKEGLIRLLNVVQHHFSSPNAVLVRNPDAMANLSRVQGTD